MRPSASLPAIWRPRSRSSATMTRSGPCVAFNRMTQQLSAQREDLIAANRLIDQRRRFTETVLSGVSAGVIGLDNDGKITIVNRAAARLLDAAPEELEGRHYSESVP